MDTRLYMNWKTLLPSGLPSKRCQPAAPKMVQAMYKKRNSISGQWSPRLIEMLESPAYRVLSRAAHLVISRIEIELGHHGGNDNGQLPVTVEQFVQYGVHPMSVAPATREAEALGFIRVTERGRGGNAEHRSPNKFLLTFAHGRDSKQRPPTHDWRRIKTEEQAEQVSTIARANKDPVAISRGNRSWKPVAAKTFPDPGFYSVSTPKTVVENPKVPTPETGVTGSPRKPGLLSIFREGERSDIQPLTCLDSGAVSRWRSIRGTRDRPTWRPGDLESTSTACIFDEMDQSVHEELSPTLTTRSGIRLVVWTERNTPNSAPRRPRRRKPQNER